jgi:hypothetical protein
MPKSVQAWLFSGASVVYLVLSVIVWKKQGYDVGLEALHLIVTVVLWGLLAWSIHSYRKDSKQVSSLRAQIVTIKDEAETQIAHYKQQADQDRQKAEQATRERSEFQGRAYDATQKLSGCKYLIEQQIATIHRLEGELSEYKMQAKAAELLEKTPEGLRKCVSALAGSLFSILVEIGEKLESPIMTREQYADALVGPPDERITVRAAERKIGDRLRGAYLCARDIGVLPECVAWPTSIEDLGEVRARIRELGILSEALLRRFPDPPIGSGTR